MSDSASPKHIHSAMADIFSAIGAIGKDRENEQQGFKFRGIDQAYNAVHPLLAKHRVFTVPRVLDVISRQERTTRHGSILSFTLLKVEYDFTSGQDGSFVTVGPIIGEGMDSGDKGCAKALSIAHKYAIFQTFCIPTETTDDPDFNTHEDVLPTSAPDPFAGFETDSDDTRLETPQDAKAAADIIINLAQGMHATSTQALIDFWDKNKRVIDVLDQQHPEQYQRVRQAFAAARKQLETGEPT